MQQKMKILQQKQQKHRLKPQFHNAAAAAALTIEATGMSKLTKTILSLHGLQLILEPSSSSAAVFSHRGKNASTPRQPGTLAHDLPHPETHVKLHRALAAVPFQVSGCPGVRVRQKLLRSSMCPVVACHTHTGLKS